MRIAIMGTGGIGGYFGARLSEAGHEVLFVARGAHLQAMLAGGLVVNGDDEHLHIHPIEAVEDTSNSAPVDAILFCVKLYDAEGAAKCCLPLLGDSTYVITVQNGVECVDQLGAILGPQRILGGATYVAANIFEPGVIRHIGDSRRIDYAEQDGSRSDRAVEFLTACEGAGLDARLEDDMQLLLWRKFVFVAASSGLNAATRQPVGVMRDDPIIREVMIAAIEETVALSRALNIGLPEDISERVIYGLDNILDPDAKASQLVDLERGRPLEVEWLSGGVHRLGEKLGVPTPVHSTIYAALRPFANGTRS